MIGVQTFNVQCEEYLLDKYFLQIILDGYMVLGFENMSMAADAHGVGWYVLLQSLLQHKYHRRQFSQGGIISKPVCCP